MIPALQPIPELADEAGALVHVERGEQHVLALLGGGLLDPAPAEGEPDPVDRRAVEVGGHVEEDVPSAESSTGEKKNSPPGMFTCPSSSSPVAARGARRVRSVSAPTIRTSSAASKRASRRCIAFDSSSQSRRQAP